MGNRYIIYLCIQLLFYKYNWLLNYLHKNNVNLSVIIKDWWKNVSKIIDEKKCLVQIKVETNLWLTIKAYIYTHYTHIPIHLYTHTPT